MPSPFGEKLRRQLWLLFAFGLAVLLFFAAWGTLRRSIGRFAGDFFYPYLASSRLVADALSDRTLLLFSRRELAQQLEMLRIENRRLSAQSAAAAELLVENGDLRRLMRLAPPAGWRYLNAEIILRDPRFWNERVTIDHGSSDGVNAGSAAMTATSDGRLILVGIVDKVNRHTAEIVTVFNPELRLSASLPLSGAVGVINAGTRINRAPGMVHLGFLPVRDNYIVDEVLLTTGFERQVPPGIKIGNLHQTTRVDSLYSSALYTDGLFLPAVQLNSIRFVVVADRTDAAPEARP